MRVLLAFDASAGARGALELTAGIDWPAGTDIRVASVIEPLMLTTIGPLDRGAGYSPELDEAVSSYAEEQLAAAVERLRGDGRTVDGVLLRGRAASSLLDAARDAAADLLIVGSRGHGSIRSLLLGSVSAELVDHATCPVLVARQSTLGGVVFATDGSAASTAAEGLLTAWPIFAGLPIHVVSVADVTMPWTSGIAPTMVTQVMETYAEDLEGSTQFHTRLAEDAAARLLAAGRTATPEMRQGDAAAEVIAATEDHAADLVVIGSRGRTGLTRFLLGSVARNVVSGTDASVLVVRAPAATSADGDQPG